MVKIYFQDEKECLYFKFAEYMQDLGFGDFLFEFLQFDFRKYVQCNQDLKYENRVLLEKNIVNFCKNAYEVGDVVNLL